MTESKKSPLSELEPSFIYYIATISKTEGFGHPFDHRLISMCYAHIENGECTIVEQVSRSEKDLAARIFHTKNSKPNDEGYQHIVTFMGDKFVLPVLTGASLRHCIPGVIDSRWHFDMLRYLTGDGAITQLSLSEYGQYIGLPAREPLDVAEAWKDKDYKIIQDRLRADVFLISMLWLRQRVSTGCFHATRYAAAAKELRKAFRKGAGKLTKRYTSSKRINKKLFLGEG